MKLIYLLLILSFIPIKAQCPEGNLTFLTQEQLDQFAIDYPNCTHFPGSILIGDINNLFTDITNIDAMSQLQAIDGNLILHYLNLIPDIEGLSQLESVGGDLKLEFIHQLTNLEHLSNLNHVNYLRLYYLGSLNSIEDLQISECALIGIESCFSLSSLNGIQSITTPYTLGLKSTGITNLTYVNPSLLSSLYLESNYQLNSIAQLRGMTHLDYLMIDNNPILISSDGLQDLQQATNFTITNSNFTSLEHVSSLTNVEYYLTLVNLPNLTTLGGFNNLESVGMDLAISGTAIQNLMPLYNLVHVERNLNIRHNPNLVNLIGLYSFNEANQIDIFQNNALESLLGLNYLTTILDEIIINENTNLQNVEGLNNLVNANRIRLISNPNLVDITALSALDMDNLPPFIFNFNSELSYCHIPTVCAALASNSTPPSYIEDNQVGCRDNEEVLAQCTLSVKDLDSEKANVTIYPNPAQDFIYFSGIQPKKVIVYNEVGEIVLVPKIALNSINIQSLNSGVYVLQITDSEEKNFTQKFMKK